MGNYRRSGHQEEGERERGRALESVRLLAFFGFRVPMVVAVSRFLSLSDILMGRMFLGDTCTFVLWLATPTANWHVDM